MKKVNFKKAATKIALTGGGAVASNFVGNQFLGAQKPIIRGAIKTAIGAIVLPMLGKGDTFTSLGDGFIADGALEMAAAVIPGKVKIGYGGDASVGESNFSIDEDYSQVSGYDDPAVGGYNDPAVGDVVPGMDL